jgi:hypothetical protein
MSTLGRIHGELVSVFLPLQQASRRLLCSSWLRKTTTTLQLLTAALARTRWLELRSAPSAKPESTRLRRASTLHATTAKSGSTQKTSLRPSAPTVSPARTRWMELLSAPSAKPESTRLRRASTLHATTAKQGSTQKRPSAPTVSPVSSLLLSAPV